MSPTIIGTTNENARLNADQLRLAGEIVVEMDGNVLGDAASLMRELAAAFTFPEYFGANLAALADAFDDLRLSDDRPLSILVLNVDALLVRENCSVMHGFLSTFCYIAKCWSQPEILPDGTELPPRQLTVILGYDV